MFEINADLHIHGLYSGAVSSDMTPSKIGEQAKLKGLQLIGTGDALHERWLLSIKEQLVQINECIFEHKNRIKFILQTEVEDVARVHHIILFPSISKVEEVRERLRKYCTNLNGDGRPKLSLSAVELAQICLDAGCLVGPSHAFVPWTSIFKSYDSIGQCYGDLADKICFLELGLSANTAMADRISELHRLTFLSASDAHSPWPNKLGREFTTFRIGGVNFEEISMALRRVGGRCTTLNVKFNPLEGKYNRTRCISCLTFFDATDAASYKWKCPACGGIIKKGVHDRIAELADLDDGIHPGHRPPCVHIIPLSEIIAIALRAKSVWSAKVQELWRAFVERYGNEALILTKIPIDALSEIHRETAQLIQLFREDKFAYIPGGGGVYGIPIAPGQTASMRIWRGSKVEVVEVGEIASAQARLNAFL